MQWVAQSAKDTASKTLEKRLWDVATGFSMGSERGRFDFVLVNPPRALLARLAMPTYNTEDQFVEQPAIGFLYETWI